MSVRDLLAVLDDHEARRRRTVSLVASENLLSPACRRALASDVGHRYVMPPEDARPPGMWDYPNQSSMRELLARAEELACARLHGEVADVRPLSGNGAAAILLTSALDEGGTVASVPAACGGHFATAALCKRFGLRRFDLPYDDARGIVDVREAARLCAAERVDLVFLDASTQLFPHPVRALREALPARTRIVYDASHAMGLIASGRFQDPLGEGADAIQGSTHKSLFGPQKGLFVFRDRASDLARRVLEATIPLFVSNVHPHHVLALAIALAETAEFGGAYADRVVENARSLGAALHALGFDILFPEHDFSASHQLVCAVGSKPEALRLFDRLEAAGVYVNLVSVPHRHETYGFRIGVAEAARRGMGPSAMRAIAELFAAARDASLPDLAARVAPRVAALSSDFPGVAFCHPEGGG